MLTTFQSWIKKVRFAKSEAPRRLKRTKLNLECLEDRTVPTVSWTNPLGGDWSNGLNWSSLAVPGPNDDVVINAPGVTVTHSTGTDVIKSLTASSDLALTGGSLSITNTSTCTTFTESSGTLTGAGSLTASGLVTWTGGAMSGTGSTVANGGLAINSPATDTLKLDNRTLTNTGAGTMAGVTLDAGDNAIIINNNNVGATFDVQDGAYLRTNYLVTGTATFNNQGLLSKLTGNGNVLFQAALTNTGTVKVQSGTFNFSGGGSNSGQFNLVASGASAGLTGGTFQFQNGATGIGAGALTIAGGTLEVGTGVLASVGNLTETTGTLTGAGQLFVPGLLTWTGGTMSGTGRTLVGGLAINSPATDTLKLDNRTLINTGAGTMAGVTLDAGDNAIIDNNNVGATFDVQDGAYLRTNYLVTGTATFNNQGLLSKLTGNGNVLFQAALTNTGTVKVQSGTFNFSGGGSNSGQLNLVASGASAGLTGGTFQFQNGATGIGAGALYIAGGTLAVDTGINASVGNLTETTGTVTGAGQLTVTGLLTWTGGTMSGTGTTQVGGLAINSPATDSLKLDNRTLTNTGAGTMAGVTLDVGNNAIINNLPGASFDVQDSAYLRASYLVTGTATFNNQGLLSKVTGAGTATFQAALINTGTVKVQSGAFNFSGGGSNSGQLNLVASGASAGLTGGTFQFQNGATGIGAGALYIAGGTLAVDTGINASVGNLTETTGTVTGAGQLTVTGLLTWTGGTMSGTGTTQVGGLAINSPATDSLKLDNRTLTNTGAGTMAGVTLDVGNNAIINNLPGASFDVQDSAYLRASYLVTGTATFNNQGLLSKVTGAGTATFQAALINTGTVKVQSGAFNFSGGGSNSGQLNLVASGASAGLTGGTFQFQNGATGIGAGALYIAGGTLAVDTGINASVGNLTETTGTVTGAGQLTVTGLLTWTGGTMSGTGTTQVGGLAINSPATDSLKLDNRTLTNTGAGTMAGVTLDVGNNAIINNNPGATFDVQDGAYLRTNYLVTGTATFNNQGLLSKLTGNGTATFQAVLNNTKNLVINSGTFNVAGGSSLGATSAYNTQPNSTFSFTGNLLGSNTSASAFTPFGTTLFDGAGTAGAPQLLEAMSQDLGNVLAGFSNNFDYGTLSLSNSTYVQLVNQVQNSPGNNPEAVYVNSVNVPAGSTLDLNGLHLYTRAMQIGGTVLNGTINVLPTTLTRWPSTAPPTPSQSPRRLRT